MEYALQDFIFISIKRLKRAERTVLNTDSLDAMVNLKTYKQLFEAFSKALYFDDDRKRYHGISTALIGKKMAEESGLASSSRIFYSGLIHDLGGIGLSHHIVHYALATPTDLEELPSSERRQAKAHGHLGAEKLEVYEGFEWALDPMRDHHERSDGTGLPEGKSGAEVPIGVEVIGAADMLDLFLCSLEEKERQLKKEFIEGLESFLETHGGFRDKVRKSLFQVAGEDDFIHSLLSIQDLERMLDKGLDQLTPPGGVHLEEIAELLGSVIDIKSNYTEDHSNRVASLSEKLGKEMGMTERELRNYRFGAYLHDLGKVGIDKSIIDKPESLTEEEYEKIKRHPRYSEKILSEIDELEKVAKIAGQHHENYDGTGYPRGLEGEDITLGARILTVIDAWDAMTSNLPYRDALSEKGAINELRENAGTQFDPRVVGKFLEIQEESD